MRAGAHLQTAIELLDAIEAAPEKPADAVLADCYRTRRYAGSKDRMAIGEIVYGVLRRRAEIDWHLERAGTDPTARHRAIAWLALMRGASANDIAALARDGDYGPAGIEASEIAMVEAINAFDPETERPEEVVANLPGWALEGLKERFGEGWRQVAASLLEEAPVDVRVNRLKATREDARAMLDAEGIYTLLCPFSPVGLRLKRRRPLTGTAAFRSGAIEVQDEGSQLAALLVDARPGMKVVDFCAGAGGKTLAIAAEMGNAGRIVACDTSEHRLNRAGERLKRAGSFIVERRVLSSARDKWVKRRAGRFDGGFDRVLVDAPCSGSGTWRRNPDQKWKLAPDALAELSALQGEILDSAARLVAPGGRLVYVTCSMMRAENEAPVERFLAARPDFFLHPIGDIWRDVLGGDAPGEGPMLALNPRDHGTDGFFIAVLGRKL